MINKQDINNNVSKLMSYSQDAYNDAIQLEINVLDGINPISDIELVDDYRKTAHKMTNKALFILFYSA
jgi:hypothetical protein